MPARLPGVSGTWAEQHINRSQGWEEGGAGAIHLLRAGQTVLTPQMNGAWETQEGGQQSKSELRGGILGFRNLNTMMANGNRPPVPPDQLQMDLGDSVLRAELGIRFHLD